MTNQHQATPDDWAQQEDWANRSAFSDSSCIIELRDRIEALEAAQHNPRAALDAQPEPPWSGPLPKLVTSPTAIRPVDRYELGDAIRRAWLKHGRDSWFAMADEVFAALAQPEPVVPTDEELVNFRNRATGDCCASRSNNGANLLSGDDLAACQAAGLRAVLARWGTPAIQPVPVSERLPGPEDLNGEGWCWWFDGLNWMLDEPENWYTHWLPANALPTLEATND